MGYYSTVYGDIKATGLNEKDVEEINEQVNAEDIELVYDGENKTTSFRCFEGDAKWYKFEDDMIDLIKAINSRGGKFLSGEVERIGENSEDQSRFTVNSSGQVDFEELVCRWEKTETIV